MRAFSIAAAGLLASATSAQASRYLVRNFCPFSVYLSFANTTQTVTDELLSSGLAFLGPIAGEGNSVGVTNQPGQYWSATGWKAIFGTSTKDGKLWWSLSDLVGDPIAPHTVNVTSSGTKDDVCGHATDYMGGVHNCPDNGVTYLSIPVPVFNSTNPPTDREILDIFEARQAHAGAEVTKGNHDALFKFIKDSRDDATRFEAIREILIEAGVDDYMWTLNIHDLDPWNCVDYPGPFDSYFDNPIDNLGSVSPFVASWLAKDVKDTASRFPARSSDLPGFGSMSECLLASRLETSPSFLQELCRQATPPPDHLADVKVSAKIEADVCGRLLAMAPHSFDPQPTSDEVDFEIESPSVTASGAGLTLGDLWDAAGELLRATVQLDGVENVAGGGEQESRDGLAIIFERTLRVRHNDPVVIPNIPPDLEGCACVVLPNVKEASEEEASEEEASEEGVSEEVVSEEASNKGEASEDLQDNFHTFQQARRKRTAKC
ncbi:hypothetical protein B0A55_07171 [Friedmanniomyces simplex]|uniref:Uncharacterized protein n=1 Tax=Friedmanniomyces simplex TaxID=329884 RepID=A0A4U0X837_9PEZI|nr:hypothetical protein B0A55_07171 [Friedmanniomyces simplex]